MINLKSFKKFILESFEEVPSYIKLIRTAERDGYITGHEISAGYILDAAKKVAEEWDKLNKEEQKVFRDIYYKKFLKLIKKQ